MRENALLILHIFAALTSQKSGKHARFLGLHAVHVSHHACMRIAIENVDFFKIRKPVLTSRGHIFTVVSCQF